MNRKSFDVELLLWQVSSESLKLVNVQQPVQPPEVLPQPPPKIVHKVSCCCRCYFNPLSYREHRLMRFDVNYTSCEADITVNTLKTSVLGQLWMNVPCFWWRIRLLLNPQLCLKCA